jgi:tRNA A37 threonylcarbamoyladenosine dehydratase
VIDAIDQVRVKAAMIAYCKQQKISIITVGAAGGKVDVTQIKIADLTQTIQDPIASKVRALLRKNYHFPRHAAKFKVECVYSSEPLRYPQASCDSEATASQGLNCTGFGSAVSVTASFGLFAAGRVLHNIAKLHINNKELL